MHKQKVTKITFSQKRLRWGLSFGHIIDYNRVRVLRDQRHIPSRNKPQYPTTTTIRELGLLCLASGVVWPRWIPVLTYKTGASLHSCIKGSRKKDQIYLIKTDWRKNRHSFHLLLKSNIHIINATDSVILCRCFHHIRLTISIELSLKDPPPRNYLILLVRKNSAFKVVIGGKKIVLTLFLYSL